MACHLGLIAYTICHTVAFLFILVGTPLDMFRAKDQDNYFSDTPCVTIWGYKPNCFSKEYPSGMKTTELWSDCKDLRLRFQACQAWAIIGIVTMAIGTVCAFLQFCCWRPLRWVCFIMTAFGIQAMLTVFGTMAIIYHHGYCGMRFKYFFPPDGVADSRYGAGFALYVAAFCLSFISMFLLMIPPC